MRGTLALARHPLPPIHCLEESLAKSAFKSSTPGFWFRISDDPIPNFASYFTLCHFQLVVCVDILICLAYIGEMCDLFAKFASLKFASLTDDEILYSVCSWVSNGGNILDYCVREQVPHEEILRWLDSAPERRQTYEVAIRSSWEWGKASVLRELSRIALLDTRDIIDDEGRVKPVSQWPSEVAHAVSQVEVIELKSGHGVIKKIKLENKIRALELIGRELGMFVERKDVQVSGSLAELVKASMGVARDEVVDGVCVEVGAPVSGALKSGSKDA